RVENGGCGTHLVDSSPWILSVHQSTISWPRITSTTAQTQVATRRVPVRRPDAAPLERQRQSGASAPSSIPAGDRRSRGGRPHGVSTPARGTHGESVAL